MGSTNMESCLNIKVIAAAGLISLFVTEELDAESMNTIGNLITGIGGMILTRISKCINP